MTYEGTVKMDNTARALLLMTLLATTCHTVSGDCRVNEIGSENPCGGQLICDQDLSEAISNTAQMPCLYMYMDYSEEHTLHQNFTVTLKATGLEFTANDSLVLRELKDHIIAVSITNGKVARFPDAILDLWLATEVDLSGNKIEDLNLAAFSNFRVLNVLNVSYNNIERLTLVRPGGSLFAPINTIDLSHNKIKGHLQNIIPPYLTLRHLNLSFNYIESFSDNQFTNLIGLLTLDISNNRIIQVGSALTGLLKIEKLLLDHNNLASLDKNSFYGMSALKHLNISSNSLKNIASSSFSSLYVLQQLDLSNNQINVLAKSTFRNNSLLRSLDVSFNKISKIESGAFAGAHIEYLKLHNNTLAGYLDTDAFNGLFFEKLDLSDADIGELGPDLFGPNPSFQSLNFSKNVISKISKTTFRNLNLLVELDLSYNKLQRIDFDTTDLKNLANFYINNNAIKVIKKTTFEPLNALNMIDLSSNDIRYIEALSFKNLNKVNSLNLKDNPLTDIPQYTLDGLISCYSLDLSGTKITKLLNNSFNALKSLNKLNMSYSSIELLEYNVFKGIESLEFLDLSHNRIESFSINNTNFKMQEMLLAFNDMTFITEMSFQGLRKVLSLDISHNRIANIQPGSFRDCESLHDLKLNNNYLLFLQFGVFDGLKNVESIDLSSNRFHRFDGKIFYYLPNIETVYLDNNFIDKLNFSEFSLANIVTLSIGGNRIPCESLTSLEKHISLPFRARSMPLSVVAKNHNYVAENINGIACTTQTELDNGNDNGNQRDTKNALAGNVYLEKIVNLNKDTNRYMAANLGVQGCAVLVALSIFVYFKFRRHLTLSRTVSSSREALSNAIELE